MLNISKDLSWRSHNFDKIQSELVISRNVKAKLQEEIVTLKRQLWGNREYFRRECLELNGIPETSGNNNLKEAILKIFERLEVIVNLKNMENSHWLPGMCTKKVIVNFSRWEDANNIWKSKKQLKRMNLFSFSISNPEFIDDGLCSCYKMLYHKCKDLWTNKFVQAFWVWNGLARLKATETDRLHSIAHSTEL